MALVCVGSVHGSPGATTLALLAAGAWPRQALLVEADPAGGVLAARYGLGRNPGLADLAAVAEGRAAPSAAWQAAQELPGGLGVVVAPESGEVVTGMLADAGAALASWCGGLGDIDVVVDCGRVTADAPTTGMLREADAVCVVARPNADELYPAAHRLYALARRRRGGPVGLVLVGERPYPSGEVEERLSVRVLGVLAEDARTARILRSGGPSRALRRSPLVRSVQSLVDTLADRLGVGPMPPIGRIEAGGEQGALPAAQGMGERP